MRISLTNRLMAFFLAALALVLSAFSLGIYLLAELYLSQQLEDRAAATLKTLLAAAEVRPDGLAWKRSQHKIEFWHESQPTIWAVFDKSGILIDSSADLKFPVEEFARPDALKNQIAKQDYIWKDSEWRIYQMKLQANQTVSDRAVIESMLYDEFIFVTAWPLKSLQSSLYHLAGALISISGIVWIFAAFTGRWFFRQALNPLTCMTKSVRSINADQLSVRLKDLSGYAELQSLSQAFNELMDRLQDSFARQSRFSSEASHQMRTPLAAMLGQIEVALRRDRPTDEYKRVLTLAQKQAIRLQKIVELLLFLSRADAEASQATLEAVNICSWLEEHVRNHWAENARFKDICLQLPDDRSIYLRTHGPMLGQAVDNYIDNALKYSKTGSMVKVGIETSDDKLIFFVQDEGQGINPDDLAEVFSPFFRSREARSLGVDGVGLGLAIVSRIAQSLGGRATVVSQLGAGSRFSLLFPKKTALARPSELIELKKAERADAHNTEIEIIGVM